MKILISLFCAFFCLLKHEPGVAIDENALKISLYFLEEGENLKEITLQILAEGNFSLATQQRLKALNRRFFVFTYPSDGMQIKSMISFVDSSKEKPLLVILRGAKRMEALPAFIASGKEMPFVLESEATIVLGSYRDGISPGIDQYGGEDVNDVGNLTHFLPRLFQTLGQNVDTKKRFLMGMSRGGMQMMLALSKFPEIAERFDKFVSLSGILNIDLFANNNPLWKDSMQKEMGCDGTKEWFDERNPILHVGSIKKKNIPLLIIQGTSDPKVLIEEGRMMLTTLQDLGFSNVSYWEVDGGDHCLKNRQEYIYDLLDWLNN